MNELGNDNKYSQQQNNKTMISVILPSYNSETTIEPVLTALKNQSYNDPYEIILVDSSEDKTPEIVRSKFPEIKYIHLKTKTDPGTARNLGLKESTGKYILFIDSDCVAQPDWIEKMVSMHDSTDHAAVGGGVINGNDPKNNVAWAGYMAEFREFIPEQGRREVGHIPTCNISYKRRYLEDLGGFNPNYYPQEDLDFNHRLVESGATILFNPEAQVAHNHRTTVKDFVRHQKNVGRITSTMLNILPLEGSKIARSKLKTLIFIPFIPVVKWFRTLSIFWKLNRSIILKHPSAIFIFAYGLLPWSIGFINGVFKYSPQSK
ncbi:MAG: glycosyltransferase [Calditrichaeota bacterium]|nr:MAG: glycosyltransferase [Calditrichota bacterium]MBL1206336.1 glycosyltransferase [Calditrichota bacterium]NOG46162.1 glycosyltransferase [Calditrichota bacterium]